MLFQVSFDVYNMAYDALPDGLDFSGSDDESTSCGGGAGPGAAINRCGGQKQIFSNASLQYIFLRLSPTTAHRTPLGEGGGGAGPTLHTHAGGITRQSVRHSSSSRPPPVTEVASTNSSNNSNSNTGVVAEAESPAPPPTSPPHPATMASTGSGAVTCYRLAQTIFGYILNSFKYFCF